MLEVRNLHVRYGRVEVLHGIDMHVADGEIVALVGSNGAGKTTLLRAISGLVQTSHGSVRFSGADLAGAGAHRRVARGIAQVAEGRQIFGPMTVGDNLHLGTFRRRGENGAIDSLLDRFPMLRTKRGDMASSLSGGQQQQLAIARALASNPKMLLLDEPSMGLAPLAAREVFALITELRSKGLTILLVEQNARAALKIADRAYVLESGKVVLSGSASSVASSDDVRRAYLGN